MKKLLLSILSIGFISALCIVISCKKKEDPAPTSSTTTTGGSTTGTTSTGTTSGSTTSGTTSGSTTSGNSLGKGSFTDGTNTYTDIPASGSQSPGDPNSLVININQGSAIYPSVMIFLKKPVITGTITNTAGNFVGAAFGTGPTDFYVSNGTGGSYSITITASTSTQITGTFTAVVANINGVIKNISGSFNINPSSSGSTTSSTTSGTTTSITSGSGTGSYSDGTTTISTATVSAGKSGTKYSIGLSSGINTYPNILLSVETNGATGTFTQNSTINYGAILYSTASVDIYSTIPAGTYSVSITTNSATKLIGTYTFVGKNPSLASKTVTGTFDINF